MYYILLCFTNLGLRQNVLNYVSDNAYSFFADQTESEGLAVYFPKRSNKG